jgi:hypothetical protein
MIILRPIKGALELKDRFGSLELLRMSDETPPGRFCAKGNRV